MKNQLSEIYSNKILLNEEKSSIVKTSKELDSKIGKAPLVKGQGAEKSKKDVETPSEDKKYSNGSNAKEMKESVKSYEGAFEKLFKATINEQEMEDQEMEMDIEIPTTGDGMADELGSEEETSDLVSDLREVMDRLQDILGKLSEDEGETEEENEVEESEETESNEESDEEPYQESVSMEDKGHALHNMKAQRNVLLDLRLLFDCCYWL